MKLNVLQFPGSTGIKDLVYALNVMMDLNVSLLWHKDIPNKIDGDLLFIPDGFSFSEISKEDQLEFNMPIIGKVKDFAQSGGFVVGIGDGFRILCESGLLPGKLIDNKEGRYICSNSFVKAENNHSVINQAVDKSKPLLIPFCSFSGRYFLPDEDIAQLRLNDQIVFRFCDRNGRVSERFNPGGSVENIAGVCNKRKNVFGLGFNPERACDDELGNTDGGIIFKSLIANISK